MKLSLKDKIDRDTPLNRLELMAVTGFGRLRIKRINPPIRCGMIRLSDFWSHYNKLPPDNKVTTTAASLEPSSDLRLIVDKMRAPRPAHARPGASRLAPLRAAGH